MTVTEINKKARIITNHKSRTIGIILAIFFGGFAWLYTYKLDKTKFWIAFIMYILLYSIMSILVEIIYISVLITAAAIIDMSRKPNDMFVNYDKWKVK